MKKNFHDKPLKLFLSYIRDYRGLFWIDTLCAIAFSAVDLAFPLVTRNALNRLLPDKLYRAFFIVMLAMAAAYVIRAGLYYVITVVGHRMGVRIEADMRRDLFEHLEELSFSYYDHNRTGVLLSRITSELFDITELAHHGPENLIICCMTIAGALALMFTIEPRLALVLTLLIPLSIWFTLSQRKRMLEANLQVKKKTAEITAAIESSISGIRTTRAFGNQEKEMEKFDRVNDRFRGAKRDYYKVMATYMGGLEFTTGIMQVAVIAVGGLLIMKGTMDYVDLITFSLFVSTFVSPIKRLTQFMEMFMQGSAGYIRFLEVMRTEPEITDVPEAEELGEITGNIEMDHVSFHYDNGIPVLTDINLKIPAGSTLAVVGPSGGGKTTLCQLLPRFYEVSDGRILVDGNDIRKVTQQSLRRNIGVIQQSVFMFAGTVRDNILYGNPEASEEEVIRAAKLAQIHDEIMEMPHGYDSYIGERGVMLSGGQMQRISIARVFLKNPKILILDEATSALDTVTEQKIQESLDLLSRGRTTIVIAHRLSTVKNADCIAVMEGEHITEQGTHGELMAQNGSYAALCRAQNLEL